MMVTWVLLTDNFLPDTAAVLQFDDQKTVLHPGLTQQSSQSVIMTVS